MNYETRPCERRDLQRYQWVQANVPIVDFDGVAVRSRMDDAFKHFGPVQVMQAFGAGFAIENDSVSDGENVLSFKWFSHSSTAVCPRYLSI